MVEADPTGELLAVVRYQGNERLVVVERADPECMATEELVRLLEQNGMIVDDRLTIGTPGLGLGVVRYTVGEYRPGMYRWTKLEDDRRA